MILCTSKDKDLKIIKNVFLIRKVFFTIKEIFKDHWDDYQTKYLILKDVLLSIL